MLHESLLITKKCDCSLTRRSEDGRQKGSAFKMTMTNITDLALDRPATCRLDVLLAEFNNLCQDYRNMYDELKSGLMETLSAFRCVNAARTHHRTMHLAGVEVMMVSIGVKRPYVTALVSVEIDTLCWWLIESSSQVLEVRERMTPSSELAFRKRNKTRRGVSSSRTKGRKGGRRNYLYKA